MGSIPVAKRKHRAVVVGHESQSNWTVSITHAKGNREYRGIEAKGDLGQQAPPSNRPPGVDGGLFK